jgi:L-alanine-DL-glutamate epimerase-like enolase superfamily enzyme
MVVTSVKLRRATTSFTRQLATSLGGSAESAGVLVTMQTDNGITGVGWAHENPFIAGETVASIESVITEVILPVIEGQDPRNIAPMMEEIEKRLAFNYRAKAAVDIALHDLVAKDSGVPLSHILGGRIHESIDCIRMMGLDTPAEMAKEGSDLRAQGFRNFKLKIDGKADDADRIRAVCDAVGRDCGIVLDATQAYTPKGIIQLVDQLHECRIDILEQPVPVGDIDGLAMVRSSVAPLVEADESIRTMSDACRILEKQAADIISLKVPKMGGIYFTRKIADLCQSVGIPNLVGGNIGPCLIDLVHTHLACSHPNVTSFACEIGESQRLTRDIASGLDIRNGRAYVGDTPGIGATIFPEFSN